jgi:hypothetical protein
MSRTPRTLIVGCLCLFASLSIPRAGATALLSAAGFVFAKLTHTPIGSAVLRLDASRNALEVLPLDPEGGDGVRVALPETKSWTARMSASDAPGAPLVVSWGAIADGRRISSASLQQTGSQFALRAAFTGGIKPTYSAQVYTNGLLVGSQGGVPSAGQIWIPLSWCSLFPDLFDCGFTSEFHNSANSQCEWRFVFGTTIPIRLPNGVVVPGNELRLVEEVKPAGHYPYLTFDAITMRSNSRVLTLFSETVR